jgi:hypothetical protein
VFQPVGPLQPQVYWRRRLVVLGGVLVVLLLAVTMCSLGGNAPGTGTGQGPGNPGGGAIRGSASNTPTPSGSGLTTITPSPGSAGGPAQGGGRTGTSTPTGSSANGGGPGSGTGSGDGSGGTGSGGSGGEGTQPNGPPQACPDSALTVTAASAEPSYRVGETPVLRLTVKNTGAVACVRDVGPREQEMLMYTRDDKRVWSSNDCYPDGGTDIRTLDPGEAITSTVVWSGLGSQPGCAGKRSRVPAGTYQISARVGDVRSKPVDLVLKT